DKAEDVAKKLAQKKATQTALARALAQAGATPGGASGEAAQKPGQVISDHFEQINKLSDGAPGAAPIDQTLKTLDDISKTLRTMGDFRVWSIRSEEHTSELQSRENLVCRLLLEKKKNK